MKKIKDAKKSLTDVQPLPSEGFIRLPQVLQIFGIGSTSFWAGVKDGRFPKPYKLGPRTNGWRVEEIREAIDNLCKSDKG